MIENFFIVFLVIFFSQIVFFVYAAINKTDKVTDLSYGLTFIIGALTAYFLNSDNISKSHTILLILISIWGVRLSGYLFLRILKTGKDKRFDGIREDFKKFTSFWTLQAASVFVILLPTTYILLSKEIEITYISYIGIAISLLGILIEGIADNQKFVFKNDEKNKGLWIDTGLWKYSRHPNYLGEIMMWVGVFIFAVQYLTGFAWITVISPLFITYLLIGVSGIPTLEREYDKRYSENTKYQEYKKKTGILFPKIF